MKEVKISDLIGTPNAILHKFGLQVFETVSQHISQNEQVTLSFEGLRNITSGFCNASIGNLYSNFKEIAHQLKLVGLENKPIWKEKVQDAIDLATNPQKVKNQNEAISELFT
jgi:hypothetical protein